MLWQSYYQNKSFTSNSLDGIGNRQLTFEYLLDCRINTTATPERYTSQWLIPSQPNPHL